MSTTVAIDGPAASGKSTVARLLASRLEGFYINTGDMYRTVTWQAQARGIDLESDGPAVVAMLDDLSLAYELSPEGVPELHLNGSVVPPDRIRNATVTRQVSYAARIPGVRIWMRSRQRDSRSLGTVVMEGRDIGTVILPDAPHKFFITASPEVRARRRLGQEGETDAGATVAAVAAEIAERDRIDSTRAVAPLKPADDALIINTDALTAEQVVDKIMASIEGGERGRRG
ncbi:MAG: (d)CMP kinase [Lentisphaerae bacterium]|nr:(d)CMP kinase [Lentisphaerota bacterium]MBT4819754.1 (d)CMP kinase [Lentisphaerota bacterium]MBT5608288.1 (d)CMP kinase [Lentisphaerota bacterium]MBT7061812.1 (d)CMP kinase [Lentisphaerota bacterium]MBT7846121.1 (d)CMP kinase [Lentisphaerota bacterium]